MIRTLFKGSLPVFFAGAAVGLCLFSFTFTGAIEANVIERATGLALMLALVAGFAGAFQAGDRQDGTFIMATWKRAAFAVLAIVTGVAGFALMAFAMSYAGVIEQIVTMFSSVVGLLFGFFAGFIAGSAALSESPARQIALVQPITGEDAGVFNAEINAKPA
jgi:hypothetical protein